MGPTKTNRNLSHMWLPYFIHTVVSFLIPLDKRFKIVTFFQRVQKGAFYSPRTNRSQVICRRKVQDQRDLLDLKQTEPYLSRWRYGDKRKRYVLNSKLCLMFFIFVKNENPVNFYLPI